MKPLDRRRRQAEQYEQAYRDNEEFERAQHEWKIQRSETRLIWTAGILAVFMLFAGLVMLFSQ